MIACECGGGGRRPIDSGRRRRAPGARAGRLAGVALALSLAHLTGCAGLGKNEVVPRVIDAQAQDELKRMTDYLANLQRFHFACDITYDDYYTGTQMIQLARSLVVDVARPDRARAVVVGDLDHKRYWYDGQQVVVLDVDRNQYSQVAAPPTIDETLDMLAGRGFVLPVADLLASDAYRLLTKGVVSGAYVGVRRIGGADCNHLAFEQDTLDWQIWIDAGDPPLPRKMLIHYKAQPGCPQYQATFTRWETVAGSLPAAEFTPQIPPDAILVELTPRESTTNAGASKK